MTIYLKLILKTFRELIGTNLIIIINLIMYNRYTDQLGYDRDIKLK